MAPKGEVVKLSSKGQIVIPARVRARLGLATGQLLTVRVRGADEIVFTRAVDADTGLQPMWRRARAWTRETGRDLVAELHERRRSERELEEARRGPGRR